MKLFMTVLAACCLVLVVGCSTTESTSVSPAAMSECDDCDGTKCADQDACCKEGAKAEQTSMGAVGEKSDCCAEKSQCTEKADDASMGAVSDTPNCSSKSSCGSTCPMTGKTTDG